MVVPFNSPSTGPTTAEEDAGYEGFESNLHTNYFTSVIGWIVSLGKKLDEIGKEEIQKTKQDLVNATTQKTRNAIGWSVLLFFLNQVRNRLSILCKWLITFSSSYNVIVLPLYPWWVLLITKYNNNSIFVM